jgi:MHS family proline/betaine transporter-like MFS transporter
MIGFALLLAAWHGPLATVLVEITPLRCRYSTLAIGYNFAAAIFGGTAPLVATFLVQRLQDPLAPCYYLTLTALVAAFLVLFHYRETYKIPIDRPY